MQISLYLALAVYTGTIIASNLLVAQFGPAITPILAFLFIGLDLSLRDWLHLRMRPWQMGALIGFSGVLTYILNPAAQTIALASALSFAFAAVADWIAFSKLGGTWMRRSIGSNVVGAAVDSVMFPTLAFGVLLPQIVIAQFLAKTCGGVFWAFLLDKARGTISTKL
ncbi:VUT family protein [Noviherbaspirillum massiliense]|uniref:VUT family protein n=1 Tax=Noviherbaspirillum massiliense TaxID=1465823 RepID=UPI00036BD8E3|nr:VUT family protein [Noviherbaspirillum massiliense]